MFKVGDIVVCVQVGSMGGIHRGKDDGVHLKAGNTYEVLDTNEKMSKSGECFISGILVKINDRDNRWCNIRRFKSLPEYRKMKLEKICSRLVK